MSNVSMRMTNRTDRHLPLAPYDTFYGRHARPAPLCIRGTHTHISYATRMTIIMPHNVLVVTGLRIGIRQCHVM